MITITNLQLRLRRTLYWLRHDCFTTERVVVFVALLLGLTWTWGAVDSMSRNWELDQRLKSRQRELAFLQLEIETLELENQYYASEEYQELSARQKQNKKFSKEELVYLPPNTEYAKTKHQSILSSPEQVTPTNLQQWLSFLFGL